MRLFVSIDLPEHLIDAIADAQDRFPETTDIRYTDPTQAHVTIQFLGEMPSSRLTDIQLALERAVESAAVSSFELTVGGLGAFPSISYITVIWTGVRNDVGVDRTTRLHTAVETEMTDIGISPDEHPFTPHITLARMDGAHGKSTVQRVIETQDPDIGTATVDAIQLKKSILTGSPPTHETVETIPI